MARIDADALRSLWDALQTDRCRQSPALARQYLDSMLQSGWVPLTDLGDALLAFDDRLCDVRLEPILAHLEIPVRFIYSRPRSRYEETIGQQSIAASDVCALLRFFLQIGFHVDPHPWIEALRPMLADRTHLTTHELGILIGGRAVGRQLIELTAGPPPPGRWDVRKLRTDTGYKLEAVCIEEQLVRLSAKGPKYRRRPEPEDYRCEYCGMEYRRGDRAESDAHRSYHAKIRRLLDPWPLRPMLAALDSEAEPELVRSTSPVWKHREMYARARQFKSEFRYDTVQWGCNRKGKDDDEHVHGFLLTEETEAHPPGTIVGACAFRLREDRWGLQWVWIAPSARRTGVLARRWGRFVEKFGEFEIEPPVSPAMQAFVRRHGSERQISELR